MVLYLYFDDELSVQFYKVGANAVIGVQHRNVNYQQQEILDSNCVDTFEKSIQNEILGKSQVEAVSKTMTEMKIKQESWLQKL